MTTTQSMTDIVERLRGAPNVMTENGYTSISKMGGAMLNEAADEIERLRKDYALAWENHILHEQIFVLTEAKIERQQKALQWIAGCEGGDIFDMCKEMRDTAKAALKEGE